MVKRKQKNNELIHNLEIDFIINGIQKSYQIVAISNRSYRPMGKSTPLDVVFYLKKLDRIDKKWYNGNK